jgi:hypothetical protein
MSMCPKQIGGIAGRAEVARTAAGQRGNEVFG